MPITKPKGTYDVLPSDSWKWVRLETIIRKVSKLYNFKEIRTPIFESSELFHRNSEQSDMVTKETYDFVDRGGRNNTLRPEGTAGVIKRWNFARLRESHGTGPVARHGGSLGVIDPARIFKGKKMAGHLGTERVTVQNLSVVKVDSENNLIAIKGSVPGPKGGIVVIADSVKKA